MFGWLRLLERRSWPSLSLLLLQDAAAWGAWVSRYSERLGREEGFDAERRVAAMAAANPVFILRNWVAQVREGMTATCRTWYRWMSFAARD